MSQQLNSHSKLKKDYSALYGKVHQGPGEGDIPSYLCVLTGTLQPASCCIMLQDAAGCTIPQHHAVIMTLR